MKDIRKERLALVITTLSYVSCVLQTIFANWEAWVPFVVTVGIVILWCVHFMQRLDMRARTSIYFAYCAFLVFYHGIHDTSMYEVSVATTLFMVTFTIFDSSVPSDHNGPGYTDSAEGDGSGRPYVNIDSLAECIPAFMVRRGNPSHAGIGFFLTLRCASVIISGTGS